MLQLVKTGLMINETRAVLLLKTASAMSYAAISGLHDALHACLGVYCRANRFV